MKTKCNGTNVNLKFGTSNAAFLHISYCRFSYVQKRWSWKFFSIRNKNSVFYQVIMSNETMYTYRTTFCIVSFGCFISTRERLFCAKALGSCQFNVLLIWRSNGSFLLLYVNFIFSNIATDLIKQAARDVLIVFRKVCLFKLE